MSVAPKPRKKKLLCICYIAFITLLLEAYKIWPRCTKHCSITECQWTLFHYSSFHYATIGQLTKMLHLFCTWWRLYTWHFLLNFLFLQGWRGDIPPAIVNDYIISFTLFQKFLWRLDQSIILESILVYIFLSFILTKRRNNQWILE